MTSVIPSWLTLELAKHVALFQSVMPEAKTIVVGKVRDSWDDEKIHDECSATVESYCIYENQAVFILPG